MGFCAKTSVFLAICVALVAVLLGLTLVQTPIPADLEHTLEAKTAHVAFTAVDVLSTIASKIGLGRKAKVAQVLCGLRRLRTKADAAVKESEAVFDGVPVLIFDPVGRKKNSPAIVYYHGGGYAWMTPQAYRDETQHLAKVTKYLVVSVDYRLAPDHPFPAPLTDCLTATKYFINHAREYGVDPQNVAIAGDSAGGGLTASVSLALRDEVNSGKSKMAAQPKAQVLIYPKLQSVDFQTPSYQQDTRLVLNRELVAWFTMIHATGKEDQTMLKAILNGEHISALKRAKNDWKMNHQMLPLENHHNDYKMPRYAADKSSYPELEKIVLNPLFSPLMAENFDGMPPALVFTVQYDCLRDDGFFYSQNLQNDGVAVKHVHYKGGWHASACAVNHTFPYYEEITEYLRTIFNEDK